MPRLSVLLPLAAALTAVRGCCTCRRSGLSHQADYADRAVPGRRRCRCDRAHRRRQAFRRAWPAGGDRQSRRSGRRDRHPRRGPLGARRLYAGDGDLGLDRDQSQPLRQSRLPHAQGSGAHRLDLLDADRADGASVGAGEFARRRHRLGQARAGQAQRRHAAARHRRLSRGRAVQVGRRRRRHHRHLSRHRSANVRSARGRQARPQRGWRRR